MIKNKTKFILTFLGIVLIFIIWQIGHQFLPDRVPSFSRVIEDIEINFRDVYWVNLSITFRTAFLSLIISFIVAFCIVVLIAIEPLVEFIISPTLIMIKATPVVAFVPLIMVFFGTSITSRFVSSVLVCMFPLVVGGIDGINRVPTKLKILAKVYNSSGLNTFYHFYSAFILESMLSALKVSAPLSLIGAMVAEFLIGGEKSGLGCYLASNMGELGIVPRYATIIFSALLGLTFYFIAFGIHKLYEKFTNIHK